MRPHVVQARITTPVSTSNIWTWIHKSNKCLIIPSGNCTPGIDWSNSDRYLAAIAWASCCLFSVEQCLDLAAFAWASCCLVFIITSGTSESRFHNQGDLPQYYHYILLSVAIVPFLSLRDSLSPLLWNLSFLRFLHFPKFKGMLFLVSFPDHFSPHGKNWSGERASNCRKYWKGAVGY